MEYQNLKRDRVLKLSNSLRCRRGLDFEIEVVSTTTWLGELIQSLDMDDWKISDDWGIDDVASSADDSSSADVDYYDCNS